jgi:peptide/nickel transport system substrate-binding protein
MMSDNGGRAYILPRESATYNRKVTVIGTGPWVQASPYEYKVGMQFRRHPDYWQFDPKGNRLPYIDALHNFVIADGAARNTAFRTGKIDSGGSFPNPTELRNLLKTNPTTLVQEFEGTGSGVGNAFRLDRAPWSDVRVRRAISLAIDYDTWAQTIFEVPAANLGMRIAGIWYGLKDQKIKTLTDVCGCPWYQYDPKRAKELLAEAGYPNGFNATMEFYAYGIDVPATMELFASYWKAIGVNVLLKSMDYTVFRANVDRGNWTDMTNSFLCCPTPTSGEEALTSLIPGHAWNAQAGFINDPVLLPLVDEYAASFRDEAKQRDVFRQIHARYLDQVYDIPRSSARAYTAFAARLRNYQPSINRLGGDAPHTLMHAWIDNAWAVNK